MVGNPFNKYCIDCKRAKTTHFLVWIGTFVCGACANGHLEMKNGGMSKTYVKDVLNEHWDDYQLKSVQLGGNKQLFEILKDFKLENVSLEKRYNHRAVRWYARKHAA